MSSSLERAWYGGRWWLILLRPLSCLFVAISTYVRRRDQAQAAASALPVIVVGNISLGGTGKTPLIISLVKHLQQQGYRPGVISRGYGSDSKVFPVVVNSDSNPRFSGDEPLLIAQACGCPVVIDPNRNAALSYLEQNTDCNIILSDDGMQHYKLYRNREIAVVDGRRGLGNGQCLPSGPLRERPERLREVDWVLVNQPMPAVLAAIEKLCEAAVTVSPMQVRASGWRNLYSGETRSIGSGCPAVLGEKPAYAIAAIGNPERFFSSLSELGISAEPRPFPDHYRYQANDLDFAAGQIVFMTAKDAVKCSQYRDNKDAEHWWVLDVEAQLETQFLQSFEADVAVLIDSGLDR